MAFYSFALGILLSSTLVGASPLLRRDEVVPPGSATFTALMNHALLSMGAYATPAGTPCLARFPGSTILNEFTSPMGQVGYQISIPSLRESVVVFRGTGSIQNGISDIDQLPMPVTWAGCAGCYATMGFVQLYQDAKNFTNNFAIARQDAASKGYNFVITGHSLGGDVSTIAAGDNANRGTNGNKNNVSAVYTYGQSRNVNVNAERFLDSAYGTNLSRTVHNQDGIVGVAVPAGNPAGYVFQGVPYVINEAATSITKCDTDQDSVCAGGSNFADHGTYFVPTGSC